VGLAPKKLDAESGIKLLKGDDERGSRRQKRVETVLSFCGITPTVGYHKGYRFGSGTQGVVTNRC
jgi:hypothetical protein